MSRLAETFLGSLGSSALVGDGKEYGPCSTCNTMVVMFAIVLDQSPPPRCHRCGKPWVVVQVTYGSLRTEPEAPSPPDPLEALYDARSRAVVDAIAAERHRHQP